MVTVIAFANNFYLMLACIFAHKFDFQFEFLWRMYEVTYLMNESIELIGTKDRRFLFLLSNLSQFFDRHFCMAEILKLDDQTQLRLTEYLFYFSTQHPVKLINT